uniref:C-type lectin domain-containing protein n=1 Tax=Echeneis naucrates TaxID=173247 RepID=A0A665WWW4_ECHNA
FECIPVCREFFKWKIQISHFRSACMIRHSSDLCCNLFKDETYPRCEEGWEHNGGKCYLFSTNGSSWEKSRDECKQLGGDLVKIDSREEQVENTAAGNLFNISSSGFPDSKNEGDWLWVDGSPLDRKFVVEHFVHFPFKKSWTDGSCKTEYKSICEKEEEVGLYTITCV